MGVLAGEIGPRLATGPAYRDAGAYVSKHFQGLGYEVRRQRVDVPAGDSWGVPVPAGTSFNVVATPPGFDESSPFLIIGAHLDSVAVAPGAEDNASGVAVLMELARLGDAWPTRLPTAYVAFGAEEPVGPGDDLHHFGSRAFVASMSAESRQNLRAMVSLDRVGVGRQVPIWSASADRAVVSGTLQAVAETLRIPAVLGTGNTTSDHWSFVKAGLPAARIGSTAYAEYHRATDRPRVIDPRQVARVGRLVWQWLRAGRR